MISKVNLKLNGMGFQFEFEGQNEMDAMNKAIAISNYPTYCNICSSEAKDEDLKLTANRDKEGNIYVNMKHILCGGGIKLGQYKQGGYFWHREFEVYKKGSKEQEQAE